MRTDNRSPGARRTPAGLPLYASKLPSLRALSLALVVHLGRLPRESSRGRNMPETALITLLLAGSLLAPAPADVNTGVSTPQTLASAPRLVALASSSVF